MLFQIVSGSVVPKRLFSGQDFGLEEVALLWAAIWSRGYRGENANTILKRRNMRSERLLHCRKSWLIVPRIPRAVPSESVRQSTDENACVSKLG